DRGGPPPRAGRASLRLPPRRGHGRWSRHPRSRPPAAPPHRPALARLLVRHVQGGHPGPRQRQPALDAGGVQRRSRRPSSPHLLLFSPLLYLRGGGDSLFVNLFFPLVAVNAYYFGRWVGLLLTLLAGLLYWAAALLAPPAAAWTAVAILMGLVGLPAFAVGHV